MEYSLPKLVGRDQEMDQLKDFLGAAINGNGNIVLVSGEAGIGKTRLVKELEVHAESLDVKVLEGQCIMSATPFLPFREALKGIFPVSKGDDPQLQQRKITEVIKKSAPHFMHLIPVVGGLMAGAAVVYLAYRNGKDKRDRVELETLFERDEELEAISNMLVALSESNPTLLFMDDLHLADSSSLSLLYYLARDVQNSKILVVGTYRPEEITKTYEGTVHPLLEIMQRMSRYNLFQKIELKRLNQNNYFDFFMSMLGVDLGELARLIYEETDGNPFFALEMARFLMQQKVLIKEDSQWKLSKDIKGIKIPTRIYDVILHRIIGLKDEERDLLDCASVVGEEFFSDVLENISGLDRIELLKSLNNIERSYNLIHSHEDGFRFDHSKIREVLYKEIAPELRAEYHLMIANYIEQANKDHLDDVINDLAYHYYRSGNAQKSIPYLLKGGEEAMEKWASFEAVSFYSQALEMMGDDERWIESRTKALEALGDVYTLTNEQEKANECFEKGIASTKEEVIRDRMRRKIRRKKIMDKNGVKIVYYEYGEGEPTLVFVVAWIWTAALWTPQVNYFSQKFNIVTVDMRGAGESDKPIENYTLDLYADDLNSLIEELPEKNIILIAESMGASIAINYVTKYPGKVSKLVLLSGSPKFIATNDFPYGWSQKDVEETFPIVMESYSKGIEMTMEMFFPEMGTRYLKEWGFIMSQKTPPEIAFNSLVNLFQADLRPLLKKITIPTLIINGTNDAVVNWKSAKYMHGNIPGSKIHIFKDIGHFPSITSAPKFNKILEEFLNDR